MEAKRGAENIRLQMRIVVLLLSVACMNGPVPWRKAWNMKGGYGWVFGMVGSVRV